MKIPHRGSHKYDIVTSYEMSLVIMFVSASIHVTPVIAGTCDTQNAGPSQAYSVACQEHLSVFVNHREDGSPWEWNCSMAEVTAFMDYSRCICPVLDHVIGKEIVPYCEGDATNTRFSHCIVGGLTHLARSINKIYGAVIEGSHCEGIHLDILWEDHVLSGSIGHVSGSKFPLHSTAQVIGQCPESKRIFGCDGAIVRHVYELHGKIHFVSSNADIVENSMKPIRTVVARNLNIGEQHVTIIFDKKIREDDIYGECLELAITIKDMCYSRMVRFNDLFGTPTEGPRSGVFDSEVEDLAAAATRAITKGNYRYGFIHIKGSTHLVSMRRVKHAGHDLMLNGAPLPRIRIWRILALSALLDGLRLQLQ